MIPVKKINTDVDKLSQTEEQRLYIISKVQQMLKEGFSYADVAKENGISTRTVTRYRNGDPLSMCRQTPPGRKNSLEYLKEHIIELLDQGYHQCGIYRKLTEEGYHVYQSTVTNYVRKVAKEENINLNKNRKGPSLIEKQKLSDTASATVQISRAAIFDYLWTNRVADEKFEVSKICTRYPITSRLQKCIKEFREIFYRKNMPLLYSFIENYSNSDIIPVRNFAVGLRKDLGAVENAVASDLSNGFVEGMNNRTKVIKRVMYGRCGHKLLTAKIMLGRQRNG